MKKLINLLLIWITTIIVAFLIGGVVSLVPWLIYDYLIATIFGLAKVGLVKFTVITIIIAFIFAIKRKVKRSKLK